MEAKDEMDHDFLTLMNPPPPPPPPYPRHPNSSLSPSPSHSPFNNLPPSIRPSSHQIPTHSQPPATPHACGAATRSFQCTYCSRKFNRYQALGGHQRAHKSERAAARRSFVGAGGDGGYPSPPTHSPRHPHHVPTFNVPPAPSQYQIMPINVPRQPHDVDDHAQHYSNGPHQYHQLQQSHQQQQPEAAVRDSSSSFLIETGHIMQQDNQPPKYSWAMDLSNINTTNYQPPHLIPAAASTYSLPQMIHGPTTIELPQPLFSSAPPSSDTHQYYHGHPQHATAAHSPGDNDTPHSLDLSLHL